MINYNKRQPESTRNKTRTLIVDGHPIIRQALTRLVNQELNLGVCAETKNANQALDAVKKQQVDLAIVDISLEGKSGTQLVEKIKLRYPNISVLILKMHDEAFYVEDPLQVAEQEHIVNEQATEQIIKAVRYVQFLLRNQIFGFTVLVEAEGRE